MEFLVAVFAFAGPVVRASNKFGAINLARDLGLQIRQTGMHKILSLEQTGVTKLQLAVPVQMMPCRLCVR
jgi:hypothetical protein